MTRYVICRQIAGLTDTLTQIGKCWDYCEKYGRELIVDFPTSSVVSEAFRMLEVSTSTIPVHWVFSETDDQPSRVDPAVLEILSAQSDYGLSFNHDQMRFVDSDTGLPVSFEFENDHPAPVLVHHQVGGGFQALQAIQRFRLTPVAREQLVRPEGLTAAFVTAHLRATDYSTNYEWFLQKLRSRLKGRPVLIASDNPDVVARAHELLPDVVSIESAAGEGQKPIHNRGRGLSGEILKAEAIRLWSELSLVSESERFYYTFVSGRSQGDGRVLVSGLSRVMAFLADHPSVGTAVFTGKADESLPSLARNGSTLLARPGLRAQHFVRGVLHKLGYLLVPRSGRLVLRRRL